MEFKSFASSSHGNCYLIESNGDQLLLECGIPIKRLRRCLDGEISSVRGCLITHEHQDHAKAVYDILEAGIHVYASAGTAAALGCPDITILEPKKTVTIGGFRVLPFPVFHDAVEPFGYFIASPGGDRLLFATDTANIPYTFPRVTLAAIECNHDAELLADSKETWRIRAEKNHMDIARLMEYLSKLDLGALRRLYLLHMSDMYADEAAFVARIRDTYGIDAVACPA